MTALKVIPGGIADHVVKPDLTAVRQLFPIKQEPCQYCRDPMCRAVSLEKARSPLYADAGGRCIDRIQARTGDIKKLKCGT